MQVRLKKSYWITHRYIQGALSHISKSRRYAMLVCCAVLFVVTGEASAQKFMVEGELTVESSNADGAKITLRMDNKSARKLKLNSSNGKFNVDLDYQHYYLFTFSKKGYTTKQISINTKCPKGVAKGGMIEPFYFRVTINKKTNNIMVDTAFYNRPVGRIFYSKEFGKFDYDRDYAMSVKRKIDAYKSGETGNNSAAVPAWLAEMEEDKESKKMEEGYQDKVEAESDSRLIAMAEKKEEPISKEKDNEDDLPIADVILNTIEESEVIKKKEKAPQVTTTPQKVEKEVVKPVVKKIEEKKVETRSVETPQELKEKKRVDGREEERVNYPNRVEYRVHITKDGLTSSYWFARYNWGSINYYKKLPFGEVVEITRDEYERAVKK